MTHIKLRSLEELRLCADVTPAPSSEPSSTPAIPSTMEEYFTSLGIIIPNCIWAYSISIECSLDERPTIYFSVAEVVPVAGTSLGKAGKRQHYAIDIITNKVTAG